MKLVIFPSIDEPRLVQVREAAGKSIIVNASDENEVLREIVDADAFFGKLTLPMLNAADQLRWVQSPTASLEHYVFPELIAHACQLTNMRGLFSDVIADHVFGYVLCFARNLHRYLRHQQQASWMPVGGESDRPSIATGPGVVSGSDRAHMHLADCTLGIVGLGSIGAEIARRGQAFKMRVLAVDPIREQKPDGVEKLWKLDRLDDLLAASDFVVIAAPHTPQTAGMFGTAQFERMKATAYLINIGRGIIVRLDELCQALSSGQIAGAGLDVFEQEPLPSEHPLWRYDNVIITPHIAACSVRIAERHLAVLVDNVRRFANREPLENVVDKASWF